MYLPTANAFALDVFSLYQQEVPANERFYISIYLQSNIHYRLTPSDFFSHTQLLIKGQSSPRELA